MSLSTPSSAPRLLVVEGDFDIREVLGELLVEAGFEVQSVASPADAIRQLESLDVSLVVADLSAATDPDLWRAVMPLIAAAAPTPVGLTTAWRATEEEAKGRGFAFLLGKPFDLGALLTLVSQHVRQGPPAAEHVALVRAYFEALSRKDWKALGALCTEDVRYHVPGDDPRFSRSVEGRAAFVAFSEKTFGEFADAVFTVESVLPLPAGVIGRYSCAFTAGGQKQVLRGAVLFFFADGRISKIGIRADLQSLVGA